MADEQIRVDGAAYVAPIPASEADPPKKRRGRPPKAKAKGEKTEKPAPAPVAAAPAAPVETPMIPPMDDDDDDVDGPAERVFTPRLMSTTPAAPTMLPPRVPGAPLPTVTQLRQQAAFQQQKVNDDFETHLASLEFDDGLHSVTVHRIEPEYDPNTNKRIAGYLEKFTRAVTFEEVRSKYGGGKYRFIIHGPGPLGKSTIKANKTYEIAGDPISPRTAGAMQQQGALPDAVSDIVEKAISTHEKTADRLADENRELTREMKQMLFSTISKGDGGFKESMMQMIAEERKLAEQRAAEERRLQEQRLAAERNEAKETRNLLMSTLAKAEQTPAQLQAAMMEERRLQEQRLAAEREERRREQEAAERRHMQTLEMMRMQQEKQIEQMRIEAKEAAERQRQQFELQMRQLEKQDAQKEAQSHKMTEFMATLQAQQMQQMRLDEERMRAEARETAERARQQFELQLRQLEKQEGQKEAQALKMTEFMASLQAQQVQQMQLAQQTQLQQMQQFTQLERDFMLKQIDSLSKKDNSIDQMLKLKQVMDVFTGSDKEPADNKETWEKIFDRINDSVPGIVAAAGLLRGSGQAAAAQPQAPAQPRVLPGSVAVVDVDDDEDDEAALLMQRRQQKRRRRLPSAPPTARQRPVQQQAAPIAPTSVETASSAAESTVDIVNDLVDFTFPTEDTPVEQALELIVKNIDLALQRDLDVMEIKTQVVDKFPPTVSALIANTDAETLVGILDVRAPATWRINSLDGQKKVRDLHTLLAAAR